MTEDRRQRHLKILELITTHAIRTQEELAEALAREGWEVTQSSVSRDIAALHLVKVDGVYQRPAAAQRRRPDPDEQRIAEGVLTIEPAGAALLVLHTPPGEANRVGAALDRLAWPEVLGNISGDDTIFLALRNGASQRKVLSTIRRLVG
jgi:transcriptional regulator of arginine metabolism